MSTRKSASKRPVNARKSAQGKKPIKRAVRQKQSEAYDLPSWRYGTAVLCISALGLLLVGRIAALQVLPDVEQGYEFLQEEGERRSVRDRQIPAYRGSILDRNGRPLAVSTPLIDITADPTLLNEEHIRQLAAVAGIDLEGLKKKIARYDGKRFMYIKRGLRPEEAKPILQARLPGVRKVEDYRRYYPDGEVLAQTLGLLHAEGHGIEGLELGYENWLSGKPGVQRVIVDRNNRVVDQLEQISPVEPGRDLKLTIDLEIQYIAYKAIKAAYLKHRAASASILVMEPKSGEILAMASQPSFNPNNRENIQYHAVRNRALLDIFEPGSTVKPFSMLAAIESGQYVPATPVETSPGYIRVDGKVIKDFRNYETLDLSSVLAKSSQVGMVKVALSLDEDRLFETFQRVGLGEPAITGFPGEAGGSLPQRYGWDDIQQATFSYGYGITASTLHIAQAYSVIANDGVKVFPSLIKDESKPSPERVASVEAVQQVKQMMREVVEVGTGKRAAVENYSVAGKTGTGHLIGAGGYEDHRYTSLFAGMAPFDDPELVVVVVVTDPQGEDYFGGLVAAPIFSEVVGGALRIRNVPGEQEDLVVGLR